MKLLKWLAWILFFPFMLTHWGWKHGKKPVAVLGAVLSAVFIFVGAFSSEQGYTDHQAPVADLVAQAEDKGQVPSQTDLPVIQDDGEELLVQALEMNTEEVLDLFDGYRVIDVDGGNLSGIREPNAVVDIGFGDREYWAFTNEYGQLVKVVADEIILQDEVHEPVLSTGRYYPDEAKVPGVESPVLDEGHVIM